MYKICYVIGTMEIGGAEKQLFKLIKNIDRNRFLPVLIALRGGILEEEFKKVCSVTIIGKKWKVDPFSFTRLVRTLKMESPDILHTFMFTSNTWGRIAGVITGVPVIIASERCVDVWKKWYHRIIDRILLFSTFKIVCNSNAVKHFYQRTENIPERKIAVIYNGGDLNEFNIKVDVSLKKEIGVEQAQFIIGAGGRFTRQKGLINLLKAVPAILKVYPKCYFIFVGDGPLRRSFEEFVAENNLQKNVIFTGYRKDILQIFSFCDVIAVPSLFEGMPNIVIEAMALKKPVVGTDIPEIVELIEDGKNGFLVPVRNNESKIADKIITLLNQPGLRKSMGDRGYDIVQKRFSLQLMVKRYEEVYSSGVENVCDMRNDK